VKQGGRIKTWKKRWVVLASGGVLYYFDDPKATAPKGVVPVEDIVVRTSSERPFAFSLSHSEAAGQLLTSAKMGTKGKSRGTLVQGHHDTFLFAAESEEERQRWMRALNKEARVSRVTSWRRTNSAQLSPGSAARAVPSAVMSVSSSSGDRLSDGRSSALEAQLRMSSLEDAEATRRGSQSSTGPVAVD